MSKRQQPDQRADSVEFVVLPYHTLVIAMTIYHYIG